MTVKGLMNDNHSNWDVDILQDLCNDRDKKLIQQIPLPIVPKLDTWFWLLDDKGVFTVKSCYRRLRGKCDTQNRLFWRKVWRLQLPDKVINFIWRACNNVLPTATELLKKKVSVLSNCSWCHLYAEDAIHTFFTCYFAREV